MNERSNHQQTAVVLSRRSGLTITLSLILALFLAACAVPVPASEGKEPTGGGIVERVAKAPIVPDGDTAGRITDFVIDLDTSMDPEIPGRALLAGNSIRITLPDEFVNTQVPALADVTSADDCVPTNLKCTTGVLLQGWPQHPIAPPKYTWSYDGPNTLVVTAKEDLIPAPPLEPGIKRIHVMLLSFTNPEAGTYWVDVVAESGEGGAEEHGLGLLKIEERSRPSINVISVFNEGAPNTIYQATQPGELTPFPFDYLLWDWDDVAMTGVAVAELDENQWLLVQGGRVVGTINVEPPIGATGQNVYSEEASTEFNAPLFGVPAGHLRVFFQAGSEPGDYVITFKLVDGNSSQRIVRVGAF